MVSPVEHGRQSLRRLLRVVPLRLGLTFFVIWVCIVNLLNEMARRRCHQVSISRKNVVAHVSDPDRGLKEQAMSNERARLYYTVGTAVAILISVQSAAA